MLLSRGLRVSAVKEFLHMYSVIVGWTNPDTVLSDNLKVGEARPMKAKSLNFRVGPLSRSTGSGVSTVSKNDWLTRTALATLINEDHCAGTEQPITSMDVERGITTIWR